MSTKQKIERITLQSKTGYHLEFLMPETMKWHGQALKITKNKYGGNVPRFEITEVVLVHCNIVNSDISTIQESHIHLFQINHLVNY